MPRSPGAHRATRARVATSCRMAMALTLLAAGCTPVEGPGREFRPVDAPPRIVAPDEVARSHIDAADVERHVRFLASDERRGRGTPGAGLERSAAWIATAFERAGLEPAGDDGGFLQYWPYRRWTLDTVTVTLALAQGAGAGSSDAALVHGQDFAALPAEAARYADAREGGLVWLGRAQDAPDSMAAAARRVAVVRLEGSSPEAWRWPITVRRSLITASRERALGVVFVLDPAFDADAIAEMATGFERPTAEPFGVPAFFVREGAAAGLLRAAGDDLTRLDALTAAGDRRPVYLSGATVRAAAPAEEVAVQVPNVVARLPGADPDRAGEYVILVAHYDHLGVGEPDESGDSIYNGADDNASGVAALLEAAAAFGVLPEPPARPVLFLAVSGEEQGLLGSTWFARNPTVFLSDAVAALNMDMIGRNHPDSIAVVGHGHSSLGSMISGMAAATPALGLATSPDPGGDLFQRSDHFAFAREGIPAVNVFSGLHEDYHTPADEAGKVNYDKIARVARLVFLTAHRIASEDVRPEWTEAGEAAIRQ